MDGYSIDPATLALLSPSKLLNSAFSQPTQPSDQCLVCGSPQSASPHFGTVSCLACAAFFRRTVALDIKFQCKHSNNCYINYQLRMICRACRYEKCVKAGMKRHCVQKRRPSKKVKDELDESSTVVSPLSAYEQHLQSNGMDHEVKNEPISPEETIKVMKGESEEEQRLKGDSQSDDYLCQPHSSSVESYSEDDPSTIPSTSFASSTTCTSSVSSSSTIQSNSSNPSSPSILSCLGLTPKALLDHFVKEESHAMNRRRMYFTNRSLDSFRISDGTVPFLRNELFPHTLKEQVQTVKFDHFLGSMYCENMPGIDTLTFDEKKMIFRLCALGFSVLDIGYISSQVMNDDDEILVFTDGSYSTCGEGDFSVGWDDEEIIKHDDKIKLFREFNMRFFAEIIRPMRDIRMDRVEHAALKALCCWKLGYYEYTNNIRNMAKEMENAIFSALSEYHQDRPDRELRLGTLILIMGNIFEMYRIVSDMYKQLDFFNLLKVDSITRALLNEW